MEMVSKGTISHVHISFMLAGHTKFAPDCLFATVGNAYKSADVFTVDELQALCLQSAQTIVETGESIGVEGYPWSKVFRRCGSFTTS